MATFDNLIKITLFKCKQVVKVKKAVKQEEINFLLENWFVPNKLQNQAQKWHRSLQETEVDGVWTSLEAAEILLHQQTFLILPATRRQ